MRVLEYIGATLLLVGGFCWRMVLGPTAFALGLICILQVILLELRRLTEQLEEGKNIATAINDYQEEQAIRTPTESENANKENQATR